MKGVTIQENTITLTQGRKGKVTILSYMGLDEPESILDDAVSIYVGNIPHMQFVDINNDNPFTRVIISGVNEMEQRKFNPEKDRLSIW
jgi:hypothetical protein